MLRTASRLAALALALGFPAVAQAQVVSPPVNPVRGVIPPDQLVSFLPETSFSDFLSLINPTFARVTGKQVIDPEGRAFAINVPISSTYFIDAFEAVLAQNNLAFRETNDFFIIEDATQQSGTAIIDGVSSQVDGGVALPATARTREIRIDAIIFQLNANRARDTGTNPNVIFGTAAGGGGAGGGTDVGVVDSDPNAPQFIIDLDNFAESLDEFLVNPPNQVDIGFLTRLFRYYESIGLGETVASPSVTVQSGERGRIQSGADIPINVQDFQGNTITRFISTGVIVDVLPTLITDASDRGPGTEGYDPNAPSDPVEFVHLNVKVENSSAQPSASGDLQILKSDVNTQVALLDGEQTVIGGLYQNEQTTTRRGIPILMDIPILKYLFSFRTRSIVQSELIIVLQARVVDPLRARSTQPFSESVYQDEREDVIRRLNRFKPGEGSEFNLIDRSDLTELDSDDD
jgi:type IV pilus assembly protein PilQ